MTLPTISCAVVTRDGALRERVMRILAEPGHGCTVITELAASVDAIDRDAGEALQRSDAQLFFLDLGADSEMALRYLRYLAHGDVLRTFVLTGPPANADTLLEAMRLGAAEYLPQPVDPTELDKALLRALRRCATAPAETTRTAQRGRVFGVFSAKGGAGVTTAAANLAVELRHATGKPTLLIDLDIEFGGAALALGLQPRYTLFDAVRSLHRLDDNLLASLLVHHGSGLDVLASPAVPNSGEPLTREQIRALLEFVRRRYEYVVVDLARVVNPVALSVFEQADDLFVIVTPDLPALRNTKKVLPLLRQTNGHGGRRVRVVLNRCTPHDVISRADASSALGIELFWTLPGDDPAVGLATAAGTPVSATDKRSRFASELQRLIRTLGVGEIAGTNGKHGLLAGLRRLTSRRTQSAGEVKKDG
jgi:pilus assembly protein CpaE